MKQKSISCFTALLMTLSMIPASMGALTVTAADQQQTGNKDGYDWELWNQWGQGSVSMQTGSNGAFSCSWSNIENCLFRSGKKLGSTKGWSDYGGIQIDYNVDYKPDGNSYMCIYGWTEDPTVEYYIVEAWGTWRPPGQQGGKGTVTSDGKSYDIYTSTRYNQPSIHGTETFEQYWSVNKNNPATSYQQKNLQGTITVSNHFAQWEKSGMKMGRMYEVALNIEGYQSNGSANVKTNNLKMGNIDTSTGSSSSSSSAASSLETSKISGTSSGLSDDFEKQTSAWAARGGSAGIYKYDKGYALAATGRTEYWNGFQGALSGSGSYTFEADLFAKEDTTFTVGVQYDEGGSTTYDNAKSVSGSADKWSSVSTTLSVPSGAENVYIYVQAGEEGGSTPDFAMDNVKVSGGSSTTGGDTSTGGSSSYASDGKSQGYTMNGEKYSGSVDTSSFKNAFAGHFKIGTSVSPFELNSGADFIKKNYNSITPENELKPDSLLDKNGCQQRGNNVNTQISLNSASSTLKFCESNGIGMRGHTFVWYSQTPGWFFNDNFQDYGSKVSTSIMDQRLESMIKNTFAAISQQYPKLELYSYDVCNELFVNDGGGLRPANNSNWVAVYGDDSFVVKAFSYARKYAPAGCKLYVNDYNEYMPAKTKDIVNIATKVKNANGCIDGIGMQSHLDNSYPDKTVYETAMKAFLDTGLDLQITELDITSNNDQKQAQLFADIFTLACKYDDRIPAVTVWGTNDSVSWRRENNPLPFSSGYQPKAAYEAILQVAKDNPPKDRSNPPVETTTTTKATEATTTTKVSTTSAKEDTSSKPVFGDVNLDGSVDLTDLTTLSVYLMTRKNLNSEALKNADVQYDGEVDIADLATLKQYVSKDNVILGKDYKG